MENIVDHLIVATETTFAIIIATIIFTFFITVTFAIISQKKKITLRLLNIAYMLLYDAVSFILPLLLVWWLSALLSVVLIFLVRKYYEKQSLILYLKQIDAEEERYKEYISKPLAVISSCIISYMFGLVCFLGISL